MSPNKIVREAWSRVELAFGKNTLEALNGLASNVSSILGQNHLPSEPETSPVLKTETDADRSRCTLC